MSIWFKEYDLASIAERQQNTLCDHLGITFTAIEEDSLTATMPCDDRTRQYMGILHGGASCVLAESVGSVAANLVIDPDKYRAVGLDINANHLRPVFKGLVTGIAKPIMLGKKTHVWEIKLYDEQNKMSCISRLTMAVIAKEVIKEKYDV